MSNPGHASVQSIIAALRRRQRVVRAVTFAMRGVFYGSVAGALVAIAAAWIAGLSPLLTAPVPILAGAIGGALLGLLLPTPALHLARSLDRSSGTQDRFASALELTSHPRQDRVRLVREDALRRVKGTPTSAVFPIRMPRELRWTPIALAAISLAFLFGPGPTVEAAPPTPEISAAEWAALHEEFSRELEQLPQPRTDEERELFRRLDELAELLEQRPDKKEALEALARLKRDIEEQQRSLADHDLPLRSAARNLKSKPLEELAGALREGEIARAASDLEALARLVQDKTNALTAEDFQELTEDLQLLSDELRPNEALSSACQQCAGAAASMNRDALARALAEFAKQLRKNAEKLSRCDRMGQCNRMLDDLHRRLGRCGGGNCPAGLVQRPGAGKGGLRTGRGTMERWDGGTLAEGGETRMPDLQDSRDSAGTSSRLRTISPREESRSQRAAREVYVEMIRKAEAELDLETIPTSQREYLREYFRSILQELRSSSMETAE